MEIITNIDNKEISFETNKCYSIVALNERNKDKFIKQFYNMNKDKICYVDLCNYDNMFNSNIYLDITNNLDNVELIKMQGFLELFKLDLDVLKRNFYKLSNSEKKRIILVSAFLSNKEIILINNSIIGLDTESKLNLIKIIKHEKRNNKVIILYSTDSNFIHQSSDKIFDVEDYKIFDKYNFFLKTKRIDKYGMKMPEIEIFRKIAKDRKNIKLVKSDNINDLIKDVYRNVH